MSSQAKARSEKSTGHGSAAATFDDGFLSLLGGAAASDNEAINEQDQVKFPAIDATMPGFENRKLHESFMKKALAMGELALQSDETPVGCVFVHNGEIIGRGMNDTNASLNVYYPGKRLSTATITDTCKGTRHAEFVAINTILKEYSIDIFKETDLYVTVEPCIMCASALRQFGIRSVYFGCHNDRFGGTGGVLAINSNPQDIDPPYPAYGGLYRAEAIMLLRRFYIRENEKAPEPRSKKNRALKTDILPSSLDQAIEETEVIKELGELKLDGGPIKPATPLLKNDENKPPERTLA